MYPQYLPKPHPHKERVFKQSLSRVAENIVSYNVHTCTRPFSFERVSLDIRPWGRGEGGGRQTVPILSPGMVMMAPD